MEAILEVTLEAPAVPAPVAHGPAPSPATPVARAGEYLSFRLGAEEYGIDILRVQEIRSYEQPTRIAHAADFVKGVVNLRGVIVPIVDLRLSMGCHSVEYDDATVVIVLNVRGRVVGAVVDSVSDVQALEARHIKPAPQLSAAHDSGCVIGIGCVPQGDAERMLVLVDIERLMGGVGMGLPDA